MTYSIKRFSLDSVERITIKSQEYPVLRQLENLGWPKEWCNWIKFVNPVIDDIHKSSDQEIDQNLTPLFAWPRFQYNTDSLWTNPYPYSDNFGDTENYFILYSDNPYDPELGGNCLYGDRNGYLYEKIGYFFPKYKFIGSSLKKYFLENFLKIMASENFPPSEWETIMESSKVKNLYRAIEKL